jgi:hypothetical protein
MEDKSSRQKRARNPSVEGLGVEEEEAKTGINTTTDT